MVRAAPLPAVERRATILASTEPLLLRSGASVSTREIAEAAGVAEGTLFRVFPSKEAIIDAVLADAHDPSATCEELARINASLPLPERVGQAMAILQARNRRMFDLFHALGCRPGSNYRASLMRTEHRAELLSALAEVFEPDRSRLQVNPTEAAHLLHAMVLATTHPLLRDALQRETADLAEILLHGIAPIPVRQPAAAC